MLLRGDTRSLDYSSYGAVSGFKFPKSRCPFQWDRVFLCGYVGLKVSQHQGSIQRDRVM